MTVPAHRTQGDATGMDTARYTPPTMDAARGAADLLGHYYPQRTRDERRAALARMYGHADWRSLEAHVVRGPASRYDEDERGDVVESRRRLQYECALAGLAGVTEETKAAAAHLHREMLAFSGESIGRRYDPAQIRGRITRARFAHDVVYAAYALLEMRPTARERLAIADNDEALPLAQRVELFPRALPAWIAHHRRHLLPHVERIAELRVRQHCVTDLLRLSFRWGELCAHHSASIPQSLRIYPVAACAKWLTRLSVLHASKAVGAPPRDLASVTDILRQCMPGSVHTDEEELRFMLAQPCADLRRLSASAREQQMRVGHTLLRRHMEGAASRPGIGALGAPAAVLQ